MMCSLSHFWLYHPALLHGLAFMLGIACYFKSSFWLVIPCLSLWFPFLFISIYRHHRDYFKPLLLSFMTFLTAWIYTSTRFEFPSLPPQGIEGMARVNIRSITLRSHFFGKRWIYHCDIEEFFPHGSRHSIGSSLPCLVILPTDKKSLLHRPPGDRDYWIQGKLICTTQGCYILKITSQTSWVGISGTFSWAEQRYIWKTKVAQWMKSQFSHPLSASFLAGIATGDFDDLGMRHQLSRFGLQHLLAISGFHFSIIASFLSFFLSLFLPMRLRTICLLLLLGIYSLFLGPQASILRAWIMCCLSLMGKLLEKKSSSLNSLGLALIAVLGYHPPFCQEIGFQLSFATTAAILLFYPLAQTCTYALFPKRTLREILQMNLWNQHGYCILAFLRQGLTLTLALNLFAFPLTLYYFQQFPLMGFLYNLFFPFFVSLSLILLFIGGACSLIPFLGTAIHRFNDAYTFFLLQFHYQIPSEIDTYLKVDSFPFFWLILYICSISLGGIYLRQISSTSEKSFAFI